MTTTRYTQAIPYMPHLLETVIVSSDWSCGYLRGFAPQSSPPALSRPPPILCAFLSGFYHLDFVLSIAGCSASPEWRGRARK